MDRALRRHRTEMVRARRIWKYRQIESLWPGPFKTVDREARFWYCWKRSYGFLGCAWEEVKEREEEEADRWAKMRNEYVVGHRDWDWWYDGARAKAKQTDAECREAADELGIRLRIRRTSKSMYI